MAFRLYIVPVVGVGSRSDPRRAKYFDDGTFSPPVDSAAMDYGFEPWMVVGANLSTTNDAIVVSKPDAFALPFDLTTNLTAGQVTSVQTKLESINVPAGWVSTSLTWVQVVRIVLGMFAFLARYAELHGVTRVFGGSVTLDTTIGSLSVGVRTDLTNAALSLGLSTVGITGTTTLRSALLLLGQQLSGRPFNFNGVRI